MAVIQYYGTGRRKSSTARVFLRPGTGQITINAKPIADAVNTESLRLQVRSPLVLTETLDKFDVVATTAGGGISGMTSALEAAKAGYPVTIVEKTGQLGGAAANFYRRVPSRAPYADPQDTGIGEMAAAIAADPNIKVHLNARVTKTSGAPGRFSADITTESGVGGSSSARSRSRAWPTSTISQGAPPVRKRATSSIGFCVADSPMRTSGRPHRACRRSSVSARWLPRLLPASAWISSTITVRTVDSMRRPEADPTST